MDPSTTNPKKEELIALLIRLWAAGAVCFFVFFGTTASLDLFDSLFLGAGIHFLMDKLVVTPVIRGALKTKADLLKKYQQMTMCQRIKRWLYEFFEMLLCVMAVIYTYHGINIFAIKVGFVNMDQVFISVEPFGYAILFTLYYYFFYYIKFKFTLSWLQGK